MNAPTERPLSADHELIVAYLDGELAPDQAAQVEQRLARDEPFRALLREMQEAWDLLDDLPQVTVDEKFTRTTVEMAAVQVATEGQDRTQVATRALLGRSAGWALRWIGCGLIGFAAIRLWHQQNEQQRLRDLPVVQRLDHYMQLDSDEGLAFLEALSQSGLFEASDPKELTHEPSPASP